jgi:hypothetical protein
MHITVTLHRWYMQKPFNYGTQLILGAAEKNIDPSNHPAQMCCTG